MSYAYLINSDVDTVAVLGPFDTSEEAQIAGYDQLTEYRSALEATGRPHAEPEGRVVPLLRSIPAPMAPSDAPKAPAAPKPPRKP